MASGPSHEKTGDVLALEREAHGLADRLPDLLLDAKRISQTVAHGIHGRRRAGPGETFWQFRQFQSSDTAQLIDWRRSASSDHLFVREREWEAAHTMWLWTDVSPSMNFRSHLSKTSKRDRALTLMLAAAELLVRGGERVGLLNLTTPTASRRAALKLAEALAANLDTPLVQKSRPPAAVLNRYAGLLLFSDFLAPISALRERLEQLAATGASGHIVQVLDPAEETLPYSGRTEFFGPSGRERWIADRAESLRPEYQKRFLEHREQLIEMTRRLGWTFLVHHTDRPAAEPLLTLVMRLQGDVGHYRWHGTGTDAIAAGDVA